ncbi:MAG: CotH kinase family protein, partial [Acholeplasmataceae bacterium]|nr:CotH kinase family protein [Acholeplasmataceae bacterium]
MRKSIIVTLMIFISIYSLSFLSVYGLNQNLLVDVNYNPTFSHESGFYTEDFYLTLTAKPNTTLYYTLDGSEPTVSSTIYTEPILIEGKYIEATGEEVLIQNQISGHDVDPIPSYPISFIRTGSDKWKSPREDIFTATILKVKAIHTSLDESLVITNTYFVDTNMYEKYTFPIISITTDIKNLYDYREGINVPGIFYDPTIEEISNQNRTGNYYQTGPEWEKPVFIEYFETDGSRVIAQEAGLRVHGGLSRKYPIKSYRLYARSEYDETTYFNYSFFEDQDIDRFKRLVLRGGGQTYEYTFMGEATAQGLLKDMDLEMQYSTPVILFMNGEYFGIRNIRDRLDDWYLSIKYDIPRSDVTILTGHGSVADGNPAGQKHYLDMYRFIIRNNMATSRNYDYIKTQMDVDNFIDYYAAQLYFANVDWPQNNIEYWRYNTTFSSQLTDGVDGRWRWMVYDVDAGFGASWGGYYPEYNSFERMTGDSWKTGQMFTMLLKNTSFKNQFINRMMDLLNSNFSS